MSDYYCNFCGRKILESRQIAGKTTLGEIPGYSCSGFLLKPGAEEEQPLAGLTHRNDELLPEVWSCCRITAIRSPRDNPPGGVIVYSDHLTEAADGKKPDIGCLEEAYGGACGVRHLTEDDFDAVMDSGARPENSGKLYVVKFTALWCPPCRVMDFVFRNIAVSGGLPDVELFEVDADVEQDLADRFMCPSLPYIIFFRNGRRLDISRVYLGAQNGGFSGQMSEAEFRELCRKLLAVSA